MQEQYGDKVEFIVVYIREAHALDGPSPRGVGGDHPAVEEPLTIQERLAVAKRCDAKLDLSAFTVVIDDIKDTANTSYAAHPDRLYLVDKEGRIAYAGGRGPREFFPNELEDSIREQLGMEPIERDEEEERGGSFRRRFR
jgi:hypothetical protein